MTIPGSLCNIIPSGRIGTAEVVHDVPNPLERLRGELHGQPLKTERHCRLLIDGKVWMTDAEFECRTSLRFERAARGRVAVFGLGLGLSVRAVLRNSSVESVVVFEINADVIALVGPTLKADKPFSIIRADAYKCDLPRNSYDVIYFDIWQNMPNNDNRRDIQQLKKRHRSALRRNGRILVWCEDLI